MGGDVSFLRPKLDAAGMLRDQRPRQDRKRRFLPARSAPLTDGPRYRPSRSRYQIGIEMDACE